MAQSERLRHGRRLPAIVLAHLIKLDIQRRLLVELRLGTQADRVRWIVADVLEAPVLGKADLWHDRAVLHFLADPNGRLRCIAAAGAE